MPITFPRQIDFPIVGLSFRPEPMAELTPLRSGKTIAKSLGPTLRRAEWQSPPLREDEFGEARAWYETLLSYEAFYGYDHLREYPLLYKNGWGSLTVGGSPFNGTGTLTSVAANTKEITMGDLPVGFSLRPGDWLSFDYGSGNGSRALHMVVAAGNAGGLGNLTIEVRPHIRVGWAASATVRFHRASAAFLILPGSWSEQVGIDRFGRVSFEAIQTL